MLWWSLKNSGTCRHVRHHDHHAQVDIQSLNKYYPAINCANVGVIFYYSSKIFSVSLRWGIDVSVEELYYIVTCGNCTNLLRMCTAPESYNISKTYEKSSCLL